MACQSAKMIATLQQCMTKMTKLDKGKIECFDKFFELWSDLGSLLPQPFTQTEVQIFIETLLKSISDFYFFCYQNQLSDYGNRTVKEFYYLIFIKPGGSANQKYTLTFLCSCLGVPIPPIKPDISDVQVQSKEKDFILLESLVRYYFLEKQIFKRGEENILQHLLQIMAKEDDYPEIVCHCLQTLFQICPDKMDSFLSHLLKKYWLTKAEENSRCSQFLSECLKISTKLFQIPKFFQRLKLAVFEIVASDSEVSFNFFPSHLKLGIKDIVAKFEMYHQELATEWIMCLKELFDNYKANQTENAGKALILFGELFKLLIENSDYDNTPSYIEDIIEFLATLQNCISTNQDNLSPLIHLYLQITLPLAIYPNVSQESLAWEEIAPKIEMMNNSQFNHYLYKLKFEKALLSSADDKKKAKKIIKNTFKGLLGKLDVLKHSSWNSNEDFIEENLLEYVGDDFSFISSKVLFVSSCITDAHFIEYYSHCLQIVVNLEESNEPIGKALYSAGCQYLTQSLAFNVTPTNQSCFVSALIESLVPLFQPKKRNRDDESEELTSIYTELSDGKHWIELADTSLKSPDQTIWDILKTVSKDLLEDNKYDLSIKKKKYVSNLESLLKCFRFVDISFLLPGNQARCVLALLGILCTFENKAMTQSLFVKVTELLCCFLDGVRFPWILKLVDSTALVDLVLKVHSRVEFDSVAGESVVSDLKLLKVLYEKFDLNALEARAKKLAKQIEADTVPNPCVVKEASLILRCLKKSKTKNAKSTNILIKRLISKADLTHSHYIEALTFCLSFPKGFKLFDLFKDEKFKKFKSFDTISPLLIAMFQQQKKLKDDNDKALISQIQTKVLDTILLQVEENYKIIKAEKGDNNSTNSPPCVLKAEQLNLLQAIFKEAPESDLKKFIKKFEALEDKIHISASITILNCILQSGAAHKITSESFVKSLKCFHNYIKHLPKIDETTIKHVVVPYLELSNLAVMKGKNFFANTPSTLQAILYFSPAFKLKSFALKSIDVFIPLCQNIYNQLNNVLVKHSDAFNPYLDLYIEGLRNLLEGLVYATNEKDYVLYSQEVQAKLDSLANDFCRLTKLQVEKKVGFQKIPTVLDFFFSLSTEVISDSSIKKTLEQGLLTLMEQFPKENQKQLAMDLSGGVASVAKKFYEKFEIVRYKGT